MAVHCSGYKCKLKISFKTNDLAYQRIIDSDAHYMMRFSKYLTTYRSVCLPILFGTSYWQNTSDTALNRWHFSAPACVLPKSLKIQCQSTFIRVMNVPM